MNPAARKIAVVALTGAVKRSRIRLYVASVAIPVNAATPGSYGEMLQIGFSQRLTFEKPGNTAAPLTVSASLPF